MFKYEIYSFNINNVDKNEVQYVKPSREQKQQYVTRIDHSLFEGLSDFYDSDGADVDSSDSELSDNKDASNEEEEDDEDDEDDEDSEESEEEETTTSEIKFPEFEHIADDDEVEKEAEAAAKDEEKKYPFSLNVNVLSLMKNVKDFKAEIREKHKNVELDTFFMTVIIALYVSKMLAPQNEKIRKLCFITRDFNTSILASRQRTLYDIYDDMKEVIQKASKAKPSASTSHAIVSADETDESMRNAVETKGDITYGVEKELWGLTYESQLKNQKVKDAIDSLMYDVYVAIQNTKMYMAAYEHVFPAQVPWCLRRIDKYVIDRQTSIRYVIWKNKASFNPIEAHVEYKDENFKMQTLQIDRERAEKLFKLSANVHISVTSPLIIDDAKLISSGLHDYQQNAIKKMINDFNEKNIKSHVLSLSMGLGKTRVACKYAEIFANHGPILIIVPLGVLPSFYYELINHTSLNVFKYHVYQNNAKNEYTRWKLETGSSTTAWFDVLLISSSSIESKKVKRPKGAPNIMRYIGDRQWSLVIVDEAHKIKNPNNQIYELINAIKYDALLCLTGTPVQNNVAELWTLLKLIYRSDKSPNMVQLFEHNKYDDIKKITKLSSNVTSSASSYESVDFWKNLQIPCVVRQINNISKFHVDEIWLLVKLESKFETRYKTISNLLFPKSGAGDGSEKYSTMLELNSSYVDTSEFDVLDDIGEDEFKNKNGKMNNCNVIYRTFLNHPRYVTIPPADFTNVKETNDAFIYEDIKWNEFIAESPKLANVDKILSSIYAKNDGLIEKEKEQVLIFYNYRTVRNMLRNYCEHKRYSYCVYDGEMSASLRDEAIASFTKDKKIFVMIISTKAGGVGLTLTCANVAIMYENDWNPQNDLQAEARIIRLTQEKDVTVYKFCTVKTYEHIIMQTYAKKLKLDHLLNVDPEFDIKESIADISAFFNQTTLKFEFSEVRENSVTCYDNKVMSVKDNPKMNKTVYVVDVNGEYLKPSLPTVQSVTPSAPPEDIEKQSDVPDLTTQEEKEEVVVPIVEPLAQLNKHAHIDFIKLDYDIFEDFCALLNLIATTSDNETKSLHMWDTFSYDHNFKIRDGCIVLYGLFMCLNYINKHQPFIGISIDVWEKVVEFAQHEAVAQKFNVLMRICNCYFEVFHRMPRVHLNYKILLTGATSLMSAIANMYDDDATIPLDYDKNNLIRYVPSQNMIESWCTRAKITFIKTWEAIDDNMKKNADSYIIQYHAHLGYAILNRIKDDQYKIILVSHPTYSSEEMENAIQDKFSPAMKSEIYIMKLYISIRDVLVCVCGIMDIIQKTNPRNIKTSLPQNVTLEMRKRIFAV